MNKTLVVVPTYNERENLAPLAQRLLSLPVPVDVLVVDDGSPDGTGQEAERLAQEQASIHVLHRAQKYGLGQAYIAGFKWALAHDYDFVFELDGDCSHNPDAIPAFLEAAQDADLVLGSRYVNGIRIINWPLSRLILSKGASMYVRFVTGMPFTDPTGGYKCFRRQALQALNLDAVKSNGYSFQIEMTHRLWRRGMRIAEVPIIFTERHQGHSKMSGHIVLEALWMVWRLWLQNKLRRRPAASNITSRPRPEPAQPWSRNTTAQLPQFARRKATTPALLYPTAYGLLAVAVAASVVADFDDARKREPGHDRSVLPLVTRERASGRVGPWEVRARGTLYLLVQGLSFTEMLPQDGSLWRHAIAPATVITVAPRKEPVRVKYVFDNAHRGQAMTIRVGGR